MKKLQYVFLALMLTAACGDDDSGEDCNDDTNCASTNNDNNGEGVEEMWWMEFEGDLEMPRIEGDIVTEMLSGGIGNLGGGAHQTDAAFTAILNFGATDPGTHDISDFRVNSAADDFNCISTTAQITVNTVEPFDADFSGTVLCSPGAEYIVDESYEMTVSGHAQR